MKNLGWMHTNSLKKEKKVVISTPPLNAYLLGRYEARAGG